MSRKRKRNRWLSSKGRRKIRVCLLVKIARGGRERRLNISV